MVGLISLEKWVKTRALIVELYTKHRKAMLREEEWRATHQCIRATRDAKGRRCYRWAPGGFEVYQSWHADNERKLLRQRLLEIHGFLNYVVRTYPWMNSYLKGLHLTIDGGRENRNIGGWKIKVPSIFLGRLAHNEDWEGEGARIPPPAEEGEPE